VSRHIQRYEAGQSVIVAGRDVGTFTRAEAVTLNEAHTRWAFATARRHRREAAADRFAALGTDHPLIVAGLEVADEVNRLGDSVKGCAKFAALFAERGKQADATRCEADAQRELEAMKREACASLRILARARAAFALLRVRLGLALAALANLPQRVADLATFVPTLAAPPLALCHSQLAPPFAYRRTTSGGGERTNTPT
jgi:hypothetical protein